jgi:nucleoside permease NupC
MTRLSNIQLVQLILLGMVAVSGGVIVLWDDLSVKGFIMASIIFNAFLMFALIGVIYDAADDRESRKEYISIEELNERLKQ